jgi:hypothetical protein
MPVDLPPGWGAKHRWPSDYARVIGRARSASVDPEQQSGAASGVTVNCHSIGPVKCSSDARLARIGTEMNRSVKSLFASLKNPQQKTFYELIHFEFALVTS